jgi:hypothetical protein
MDTPTTGWFGLTCWNGLSDEQQRMLIYQGVLPFGRWMPEGGSCDKGASVAIEIEGDEAPGSRFYCLPCARAYLAQIQWERP